MPAVIAQVLAELVRKAVEIAISGEDDAEARLKRAASALAAERTGKAAARAIIDS